MEERPSGPVPEGAAPLIAGLQAELAEVESERAHLHDLVRQAPVAIVISRGPDHVIELANDGARELLGRAELEGRAVRDAVPEIVAQGFVALMDRVYAGQPYDGREVAVSLHRTPGAPPEDGFYDLLYRPLRDAEGRVDGIFALGIDVTAKVRARRRAEALAAAAEAAEEALRASHAMLDSLLDTAPVGIGFWDRDLRYARVNEALAEINGRTPAEHVGRSLPEVLGDLGSEVEPLFRRILETGEPALDVDVTGETPAQPGERRTWTASFYPVASPVPGEPPLGVGAIVTEVTERIRRRQRERFLADAGVALESPLGVEARVRRVTGLVVPRFADCCVVSLLDGRGRLAPIAVEHVVPAAGRALEALLARHPGRPGDGGATDVVATGRPAFHAEVGEARLRAVAEDATHLEDMRDLGTRSYMCVPLRARGRTLGALSVVRVHGGGPRFTADDLAVAEELGRRVGLALDNARLFESQRHIAATLQASLLPPRLRPVPGLDIATRYRAGGDGMDVGGDFYDLVPCDEGVMLVLGDVCGKGAEAAAMTALCRYTVRAAARRQPSPAEVLRELNAEVLREHGDQRFCTAVCVRVGAPAHAGGAVPVVVSRGGHPQPYVLRAGGEVEGVGERGTLVGVHAAAAFAESPVELRAGDSLVLYTDGVTEARSAGRRGDFFGGDGLRRVLRGSAGLGADAVAARIEAAVAAHGAGGGAPDDLALLVARASR